MTIGRVYVIRSPSTPKVYVGSTTKRATRRFQNHLSDYFRFQQGSGKFKCPFEIIQHEDASIEVLEECVFEHRCELLKRERHHLRSFGANSVNIRQPGRSHKEWQTENRDKLREISRRHYYNNREEILRRRRDAYVPKAKTGQLKTDLSDHPAYKHYREHKSDILKRSALQRTRRLGRPPTQLTMQKHGITQTEVQEAIETFRCMCQSSSETSAEGSSDRSRS